MRLIAALAALLAGILAASCAYEPSRVDPDCVGALSQSEISWLLTSQLSDGALLYYPESDGEACINPYFAYETALALLESGDGEAVTAVRNYLTWSFAHLNRQPDQLGLTDTICDYTVTMEAGEPVAEISTGDYDASDSYLGLLLFTLNEYTQASGDPSLAEAHYQDVCGLVTTLLSTMTDGLTVAKPSYPVFYLTDQCEVYAGLSAAANLFASVFAEEARYPGSAAFRISADTRAQSVRRSVEERFWNDGEQRYEYALDENGAAEPFDWSELYMSAYAQMFPVIYELIPADGDRARALYEKLCASVDWVALADRNASPNEYCFGCLVYAAVLMGDGQRSLRYFRSYSQTIAPDHAYPLVCADSAWVARACILYKNSGL